MAFAKHHDPDVVDVDALSPWERELHERERRATGGQPSPPPASATAAEPTRAAADAAEALRVADAALALLLRAQVPGSPAPAVDWPTVLGGMVGRRSISETELHGAVQWSLITDEQAEALHDDLP